MTETNRLANSNSPYLLQHAHNPVDWYPWGEEAFAAAKEQDKPIFLSIGYSTCHWCHVMERESFMDSAIAAVMNENFINVKVDREERPDVDNVYMSVCQMLTGQGGWPLTVVMTPDRKPFFAATYLPPTSRGNRPGVRELSARIGEMWKTQREVLLADANRVVSVLQDSLTQEPGEFDPTVINRAPAAMLAQYDSEYGGFASPRNGYAPKFPSLHNISFILSQGLHEEADWKARVRTTLDGVMRNGIVDQVGGGIHRYSVDREWHLPHFEKMLYDQAWAVRVYAEAAVVLEEPAYGEFVDDIVTYIDRDLRHEGGAYYAAENADSEGEEGKFYVWSWEELQTVLGDDLQRFSELSGVHPQGNFVDEATGQGTGLNIVSMPEHGLTESDRRFWATCKEALFSARVKRIRPSLDDKILSAWNGNMIMALARAGYLLQKPEYVSKAEQAYAFIQEEVATSQGALATSYREGKVSETHTLEDYAGMLAASIELYNATAKPTYLTQAKKLIAVAVDEFWDSENGAFFLGAKDAKDLIVQSKDAHDGAMPSANSLMMYYVQKYVRLTGDTEYTHIPEAALQVFAKDVAGYPSGYTFMLMAASELYGESTEVVLAGKKGDALLRETADLFRKEPFANRVVLYNYPEFSEKLGEAAPFVATYTSDSEGRVFVCRNYACMLPALTMDEVLKNLRQ